MKGATQKDLEQRKSPRVDVPLLIQYKNSIHDDPVTEYIQNISMGGFYLELEIDEFEKGSGFFIHFTPRNSAKLVAALCEVVRKEKNGKRFGFGVRFVEMESKHTETISGIIQSYMIH